MRSAVVVLAAITRVTVMSESLYCVGEFIL